MTASSFLTRWRLHHGQWRNRWHASVARHWLRLWLLELHGLLPAVVARHFAVAAAPQALAWPLTAARVPTGPAVLWLPASEVLVHTLSLPLAAVRDLPRVLAFEIDKFTPFAAEQVHFSAYVVGKGSTQASVQLLAIGRQRLAGILAQCADCGLALHSLRARDAQGVALVGELLPVALRPRASRSARLTRVLLLTVSIALAALMAVALHSRQTRVEQMRTEVAAQRAQVAQLEALRRELVDSRDAASYLSRLKNAGPTTSLLLTELTTCLGDDTWLEQLDLRAGGELTLTGQSRHASALIGRSRTCPSLENAQFQGVIQPDTQSGNERFSLIAKVRQETAHAPTTERQ